MDCRTFERRMTVLVPLSLKVVRSNIQVAFIAQNISGDRRSPRVQVLPYRRLPSQHRAGKDVRRRGKNLCDSFVTILSLSLSLSTYRSPKVVPCKFLLNLDCPEEKMLERLLKRAEEVIHRFHLICVALFFFFLLSLIWFR